MDASDENAVYVYDANTSEWDIYEVDGVWGYDHSQADVFGDVEPLVGSVVHGRSACIMAYGDTLAGEALISKKCLRLVNFIAKFRQNVYNEWLR